MRGAAGAGGSGGLGTGGGLENFTNAGFTATATVSNCQEAQCAFRRDLPQLLRERPGQWVAYYGNERLGFARTDLELYEECRRRGLDDNAYLVLCIEPESDVVTLGLLQGG